VRSRGNDADDAPCARSWPAPVRHVRLLAAALLAVLAVLAAGCAADGDTATTTTLPAETGAAEATAQRCTNDEDGFSVAFPASWHTNADEVAAACSFFHPDEFEVPERTETLGVAILISREPVAFEAVAGEQPSRRDVTREELTVAGRPAVRLEYVATADGLLPEGTPVYEVLVDLDGSTLIAATQGLDDLDFEANKDVLDLMVDSLRID
jgi:hypothetical protein